MRGAFVIKKTTTVVESGLVINIRVVRIVGKDWGRGRVQTGDPATVRQPLPGHYLHVSQSAASLSISGKPSKLSISLLNGVNKDGCSLRAINERDAVALDVSTRQLHRSHDRPRATGPSICVYDLVRSTHIQADRKAQI
jgi:hypothetical protein